MLKEYIDKYKIENDLIKETADRYDLFYRNSCNFFSINKLWNLPISDIRSHHAEQFRSWIRTSLLRTSSLRHASKYVELWKRVTKYAVMMEYCIQDHLAPVQGQRDGRKKIITLNLAELRKLKKYEFQPGIMSIVRDLFLFQCFTGLSYSDIYRHELVYRKGRYWIEGERQKTDKEYKVWVFEDAQDIYMNYQGHMPRLSNQKYNEYLKEIAHLLGIKKRLTTHVGRKTFATLMAINGVGGKPISMMLGNTERVTNESYIDMVPEIVDNALSKVGSRLM